MRKCLSNRFHVTCLVLASLVVSTTLTLVDTSKSSATGQCDGISEIKFSRFSYSKTKDVQQVTLSWKTRSSIHDLKLVVYYRNYSKYPRQYTYKGNREKGSERLFIPNNQRLDGYFELGGCYRHFSFASPLHFSTLKALSASVELPGEIMQCVDQGSSATKEDRKQLYDLYTKLKLVKKFAIFLVIADATFKGGEDLLDWENWFNPQVGQSAEEIKVMMRGLEAVLHQENRPYWIDRCIT